MYNSQPIGIYDSGIGGFTVLRALLEAFPEERFVYYADNIHLPYGEKTPAELIDYCGKILDWMLKKHRVKAVIAACNTSSAIALPQIAKNYDIPVIGTIEPLVAELVADKELAKLGVIATAATVSSQFFNKSLANAGFVGDVYSVACPDFVPLIEMVEFNPELIVMKVQEYLMPLVQKDVQKIIYGCTHYPLIASYIQEFVPQRIEMLDPAAAIVETLSRVMIKDAAQVGFVNFHASAHLKEFNMQITKWFSDILDVRYNVNYSNPHAV